MSRSLPLLESGPDECLDDTSYSRGAPANDKNRWPLHKLVILRIDRMATSHKRHRVRARICFPTPSAVL